MIDFRKEIRREMGRQGYSAYRLARDMGIPARTVQIFIAGTQDTTTRRLAAMCEVLGLRLTSTGRRKVAGKRGRA